MLTRTEIAGSGGSERSLLWPHLFGPQPSLSWGSWGPGAEGCVTPISAPVLPVLTPGLQDGRALVSLCQPGAAGAVTR